MRGRPAHRGTTGDRGLAAGPQLVGPGPSGLTHTGEACGVMLCQCRALPVSRRAGAGKGRRRVSGKSVLCSQGSTQWRLEAEGGWLGHGRQGASSERTGKQRQRNHLVLKLGVVR